MSSSGRTGGSESIDRRLASPARVYIHCAKDSVGRGKRREREKEKEKVEANTDRYTAACE